jgi:hypothetical protein
MVKVAPSEQVELIFPDGKKIQLPFGCIRYEGPIAVNELLYKQLFYLNLFFEVDNEVREYVNRWQDDVRRQLHREGWEPPYDKQRRVAIGNIYLTIHTDLNVFSQKEHDPNLIRLSFTAATDNMSRLFERSGSIRNAFIHLLEKEAGVYGVLDLETSAILFWLDGNRLNQVIPYASLPLQEIRKLAL